jgi:GntR family transcriptional regulator
VATGSKQRARQPGAPLLSSQAHDALLEAIRRGDFPDDKLPPEGDLAYQLGVSRTTLRAALQQLEHDGILSRRRGIGTRIIATAPGRLQLELGKLVALDELVRQHGHESSTDIIEVRTARLPELSAQLDLPPTSEWHVITKVWRADGKPAALLVDHVPRSIISELPTNDELLATIFRLFDDCGPERIALARAELVPMLAEADVRRHLQLRPRQGHLRIWQRHFGVSGRQLATSRIDVNDELIRFELVRKV